MFDGGFFGRVVLACPDASQGAAGEAIEFKIPSTVFGDMITAIKKTEDEKARDSTASHRALFIRHLNSVNGRIADFKENESGNIAVVFLLPNRNCVIEMFNHGKKLNSAGKSMEAEIDAENLLKAATRSLEHHKKDSPRGRIIRVIQEQTPPNEKDGYEADVMFFELLQNDRNIDFAFSNAL
jgi:hypothetical protein